jgi:hypothetical protein
LLVEALTAGAIGKLILRRRCAVREAVPHHHGAGKIAGVPSDELVIARAGTIITSEAAVAVVGIIMRIVLRSDDVLSDTII